MGRKETPEAALHSSYMAAGDRRQAVSDALRKNTYGRCPAAPKGYSSLRKDIGIFMTLAMTPSGGYCVSMAVDSMSRREIRYLIKVCRALGYEPSW